MKLMWMHIKEKRTTQNKKAPKYSEIITRSLSKYISRMQFQSHPTLGLLLLTIFISDPHDRTETTFIKLTTNQLGETANRIRGQKDKLSKWSEKKDMQNTARRWKSTADILNGE